MRRLAAVLCVVIAGAAPAAQPLICFGNEPSWSIRFSTSDAARVDVPGATPREYLGNVTRNEPLRERVWRGRASAGSGDLVLFLREAECSDGMSDVTSPVIARVSLPDGAFLAGCCRIPRNDSDAASSLEGTPWRLVGLPGHDAATLAALPRGVTVRFESGRLTGFGGCNMVSGSYTVEGNRLSPGRLAGTMMTCPDPAMDVERAFMTAFTGTLSYVATRDSLRLTTDSGSVLEFEREPAPMLEKRTWSISGYNNGRQAVVSPLPDTRLTLSFENGTVSGQAGCNTFRAKYSMDGNRIGIGPAATTRKMCSDDVMTQERQFLAALASAVTWSVEGEWLHMHRADGERALTGGPGSR